MYTFIEHYSLGFHYLKYIIINMYVYRNTFNFLKAAVTSSFGPFCGK